jgi:hypothetical protein
VEVAFEKRPAVDVRKLLVADGFRWSKKFKVWYAFVTQKREATLQVLREMGDTIKPDDQPTTISPAEMKLAAKRAIKEEAWERAVSFSDK